MIFRSAPFLRYVLVAVMSILFSIYNLSNIQKINIWHLSYISIILVFCYVLCRKNRTLQSLFGYIILAIIYIATVKINTQKFEISHIYNTKENVKYYKGIISNEPEVKDKTYKYVLEIDGIFTENGWENATGKVLTYIYKDKQHPKPKYGDVLIFKGKPDTTTFPKNPGEFNLKNFYSFHQIYNQKFCSFNELLVIGNSPQNPLIGLAISIRSWAEILFKNYIKSDREQKIASALILGIKGTLDWEIMQAYANTGTMHVLAVSGLHVGIIYQILLIFCAWSTKVRYGNWLKATFLLVSLWFYALVTGLCPSILRSVTMFSFIILAEAIHRKSNIYNTLAASCLFLLLYNPYMIMEVGFQLSYLAVLGIVYMQPKIYALIATKEIEISLYKFNFLNKITAYIIDWTWSITCVSLAAQIATFPLGILYFHQFPTYFLISNLVVIPAALGIMWVGLTFVFLSYFDVIATFLGFCIEKTVYFLNGLILFIEDLPFSVWKGLSISVFNTWHIYVLILLVLIWIEKPKFKLFLGISVTFMALMASISYKIMECKNQDKITVYALNNGYAIDKFIGIHGQSFIDSLTAENPSKMQFHILNNRWNNYINDENTFNNIKQIDNQNIVFVHHNQSFLIYNKKSKNTKNVHFDYEICSNKYANQKYDSTVYKTSNKGAFTKSFL